MAIGAIGNSAIVAIAQLQLPQTQKPAGFVKPASGTPDKDEETDHTAAPSAEAPPNASKLNVIA